MLAPLEDDRLEQQGVIRDGQRAQHEVPGIGTAATIALATARGAVGVPSGHIGATLGHRRFDMGNSGLIRSSIPKLHGATSTSQATWPMPDPSRCGLSLDMAGHTFTRRG